MKPVDFQSKTPQRQNVCRRATGAWFMTRVMDEERFRRQVEKHSVIFDSSTVLRRLVYPWLNPKEDWTHLCNISPPCFFFFWFPVFFFFFQWLKVGGSCFCSYFCILDGWICSANHKNAGWLFVPAITPIRSASFSPLTNNTFLSRPIIIATLTRFRPGAVNLVVTLPCM